MQRDFAYAMLRSRKVGYDENLEHTTLDSIQGWRSRPFTDPGGAGKTRLATTVAFDMVEGLEDGVRWMGLPPLSEPDLGLCIFCTCCVQRARILYRKEAHPWTRQPDSLSEAMRSLMARPIGRWPPTEPRL